MCVKVEYKKQVYPLTKRNLLSAPQPTWKIVTEYRVLYEPNSVTRILGKGKTEVKAWSDAFGKSEWNKDRKEHWEMLDNLAKSDATEQE
jgi:hypothetical protein